MQLARPLPAAPSRFGQRHFGRGPMRVGAIARPAPESVLSDELKLFASTFAGAFLFMTVFLA